MKHLFLIITGFTLFISCEKEIVLPENDSKPQVVVNCMFAADSTWLITLSESRALLNNDALPYISNGTIKLLNDADLEIGEFIFDSEGKYRLSAPTPIVGSTYKIKVDVPGYETVSAAAYAPKMADIIAIDTLSKPHIYAMSYDIKIQDQINVANYYSVSIIGRSYWVDTETMDTNVYEVSGITTAEPYVANGYEDFETNERYAEEFFFSDELFDGDLISFKVIGSLITIDNPGFYRVCIKSYSEAAYKYFVSLKKYEQADGDFFAEPVQVISNIENGLGIFGGYSTYADTLWTE